MKNLKEETLEALHSHNLTINDIDFIRGTSSDDRSVYESVERYLKDADFDYDAEDKITDIDKTLVIVMKDKSYFTRAETSNKEFFVYHKAPPCPSLEGVICLAPLLSSKKNEALKKMKLEVERLNARIQELSTTKYSFMDY